MITRLLVLCLFLPAGTAESIADDNSQATTTSQPVSTESPMKVCLNLQAEAKALEISLQELRDDDAGMREMRDRCDQNNEAFWEKARGPGCMKTRHITLETFCYGIFSHCIDVGQMLAHLDVQEKEWAERLGLIQSKIDQCPRNGGFSEWSRCKVFGGKALGPGTQTRTCTSPKPSNGGENCSGVKQQSCLIEACESTRGEVRNRGICGCGTQICEANDYCAASANICYNADLSSCGNTDGGGTNANPCYCGSKICPGNYTCVGTTSTCEKRPLPKKITPPVVTTYTTQKGKYCGSSKYDISGSDFSQYQCYSKCTSKSAPGCNGWLSSHTSDDDTVCGDLDSCKSICRQIGEECHGIEMHATLDRCSIISKSSCKLRSSSSFNFVMPSRCGSEYTEKSGDAKGWGTVGGRGKGEVLNARSDCEALCTGFDGCQSYEYSLTSKKCNLNTAADPNTKAYQDYMFCKK